MEKQRLDTNLNTPLNLEGYSSSELLVELGAQLRTLRIRQNIDQITLAQRAGIGVSALKNLESGQGATLTTFVKTLRTLGRENWLSTLAPTVSISPLQLIKSKNTRLRAWKSKSRKTNP
jgi:transcriptional regulator with XRE-family HTH domain